MSGSLDKPDMITSGISKEHVPFGRFASELHSNRVHDDPATKSLSEGVGNISIYDEQLKENWLQRTSPDTGQTEELYSKDRTVILSSTSGSNAGTSRIVKSYTVQSKIQQVFWCSFLLPSNEIDADTGSLAQDEVQNGFCIVENNGVTIVTDSGSEHHVTLPFHIVSAWPLEKGVLFQRELEETKHSPLITSNPANTRCSLPVWFSMLHPLADLSPVICKIGTELSYITTSSHSLTYVSADSSPYLSVIYDSTTKCHSMYLIRRTTSQEEKTYTELNTSGGNETSSHMTSHMTSRHQLTNTSHLMSSAALTPSKNAGGNGYLTLSSVLSPSASAMSPRITNFGTPSLKGHNLTMSPAVNRLNPSLSLNSPSLTSMSHMTSAAGYRSSAAPSPASLSASVAHSSFTSTGNHHQAQGQDVNVAADMLEPIRPDICLQHVWTDHSNTCNGGKASRSFITTDLCGQSHICLLIPAAAHLRCIKLGTSNSATESVIFGSVVNIPAKDACPAPSLSMILVLDLESNIRLYTGPTLISLIYIPRLSLSAPNVGSLSTTPIRPNQGSIRASSRPGSAKAATNKHTPGGIPHIVFNTSQEDMNWSPVPAELDDSTHLFLQRPEITDKSIESIHCITKHNLVLTLLNGEMCSSELPALYSDPAVGLCIKAFSTHLPYSVSIQAVPRWYQHLNLSGQIDDRKDELDSFFTYLLDSCGFPHQIFSQLLNESEPSSPLVSKKKARTAYQPSDADFDFLLSTQHCHMYRQRGILGGFITIPDSPSIEKLSTPKLTLDEDGSGDHGSHNLLQSVPPRAEESASVPIKLDAKSPLASHIYSVFLILHLCYEEMKLNTCYANSTPRVADMLAKLSACLHLPSYLGVYLRDFPSLSSLDVTMWRSVIIPERIRPPEWFPSRVHTLPHLLTLILRNKPITERVYHLPGITHRLQTLIKVYSVYGKKTERYCDINTEFLQAIPVLGRRMSAQNTQEQMITETLANCHNCEELILLLMCQQGFDQTTLDSLPYAYALLPYEVIYKCQANANAQWPHSALKLIKRQDTCALTDQSALPRMTSDPTSQQGQHDATAVVVHQANNSNQANHNGKQKQLSGMEVLDKQILKMRWSSDLRIEEVKRCLNSSQPVKITLQQKPEVSDHHFIEEKQKHLLAVCQRTMSLPVGRGMLTMRSHKPALTESLHIPVLCLSGKSYPTQSSVELSSDAQTQTATKLSVWPAFHNGVAAGLCLDPHAEVDTTWILFNRPKVIDKDEMNLISEHAGFLMALGLNGHLNNLARLSLHDYLIKGHEMTAVGILLGISATMRGTMDISTVRLLTIHTPSLLPVSSTQLDIAHSTKIAALIGLGLVYHSSCHRHIAGVLLHEIDHTPEVVTKGVTTDRESYSLAAGLALGMVMMGKGTSMIGLHDLNIANQLCLLMTGGHRSADMKKGPHGVKTRTGNGQVHEGELINVDVTSAGATMALGLTYFNTKSTTICDWLQLPQSQYLLESVRPDLLQLRVIAHSLVMWDSILPTEAWLLSHAPQIVLDNAFKRPANDRYERLDYETLSQAYCYIISGGCFSIALRFAGSSNQSAYDLLLRYTKRFLEIYQKPTLVDQSGRSILENALCTCLVSLSMVMSGSGDLEVIRLCRYLRTRIGVPTVTYGSHMAIHMSLALLFLGSGRSTLSSKPDTVPLLICAFFPKFPVHSNDNRYHLQALRHLYVQAAEPRLLIPVDIDTGEPCYVPVKLTLKCTQYYDKFTYMSCAPSILPELHLLDQLEICDNRYWPVGFSSEDNFKCFRNLLTNGGKLAVKRRSGYLPYSEDPDGVLGAMARSLLNQTDTDQSQAYKEKADPLKCYQQLFISSQQGDEDSRSFLYLCVKEALSCEREGLLPIYHKLDQTLSKQTCNGLELQQLYLMKNYVKLARSCVLSKDLVHIVANHVNTCTAMDSNDTQYKDYMNELIHFCVDGKPPVSMDVWKHLALYTDISSECISSIAGLSVPLLMARLSLCREACEMLKK